MMRIVIFVLLFVVVAASPAPAQISVGVFGFSQANADRQHDGCYDWYKEICQGRMTQAIPNGLGLNNLVFCWNGSCAVPGSSWCLGCDGICACVAFHIPERLGGDPNMAYFYAFYVDDVWSVMTSSSIQQGMHQQMIKQDGNPCSDAVGPVPGMYKKEFGIPGLDQLGNREPDWEYLDYAGLG